MLTRDLSPEELAIVSVQEDVTDVLLPESYNPEDIGHFLETTTTYDVDDIALKQRTHLDTGSDLDDYTDIPITWNEVKQVGPSISQVLEHTEYRPWDTGEQELRRELVDAYSPQYGKSLTTRLLNANPNLFDANTDTADGS